MSECWGFLDFRLLHEFGIKLRVPVFITMPQAYTATAPHAWWSFFWEVDHCTPLSLGWAKSEHWAEFSAPPVLSVTTSYHFFLLLIPSGSFWWVCPAQPKLCISLCLNITKFLLFHSITKVSGSIMINKALKNYDVQSQSDFSLPTFGKEKCNCSVVSV